MHSRKQILSPHSGALKTHLPGPYLQQFGFKCSKVDPGLGAFKNSSENSDVGKTENHHSRVKAAPSRRGRRYNTSHATCGLNLQLGPQTVPPCITEGMDGGDAGGRERGAATLLPILVSSSLAPELAQHRPNGRKQERQGMKKEELIHTLPDLKIQLASHPLPEEISYSLGGGSSFRR